MSELVLLLLLLLSGATTAGNKYIGSILKCSGMDGQMLRNLMKLCARWLVRRAN